MTYQVVVTDRAAEDLEEAYRWYAQRAPEAAIRWYNGFLEALESLAVNPQRCPVSPENRAFPFELRQLLYGRRRTYRALFTIRGGSVLVLHIRHTARREIGPADLP